MGVPDTPEFWEIVLLSSDVRVAVELGGKESEDVVELSALDCSCLLAKLLSLQCTTNDS